VQFSCFALPYSFLAVPTASGPVFMFYALGHVIGGAEGVGSRFRVLRSRTRFRRFRGHRVQFSCYASPYSFSTVLRAWGPVFMFCAPVLIFSDTEGGGSHFHVLRVRTNFRRYQQRPLPFSSFALTNKFSAVRSASGTIFMFSAPELIFDGNNRVGSRFHVLRSRTRFRRFRGRQVQFSCFVLPDTFLAVARASGLVFKFCALGDVSAVRRASGPVLMFCVPVLVFGGSEGIRYHFPVLRSRTRFQRF
jgi:hypothetical protein